MASPMDRALQTPAYATDWGTSPGATLGFSNFAGNTLTDALRGAQSYGQDFSEAIAGKIVNPSMLKFGEVSDAVKSGFQRAYNVAASGARTVFDVATELSSEASGEFVEGLSRAASNLSDPGLRTAALAGATSAAAAAVAAGAAGAAAAAAAGAAASRGGKQTAPASPVIYGRVSPPDPQTVQEAIQRLESLIKNQLRSYIIDYQINPGNTNEFFVRIQKPIGLKIQI